MAHFLIEVGYTPEAWSSQIESQQNVIERITPAVKVCKGSIESVYYAFGDADLVGIMDFPTSEDAAAFALAVTASGALRSFKTTPLMTVEQGITAMKRAGAARSTYTPPLSLDLTGQKAKAKAR